jgi:hypothetical protein
MIIELETLRKTHKTLKRQLNAWNAAFIAHHNREPTVEDKKGDAKIAPVFREYFIVCTFI